MHGGFPAQASVQKTQVSVQKMDANLGHQRMDANPSAGSGQALGHHAIPTQVNVQTKDANLGHQHQPEPLGTRAWVETS